MKCECKFTLKTTQTLMLNYAKQKHRQIETAAKKYLLVTNLLIAGRSSDSVTLLLNSKTAAKVNSSKSLQTIR